MPTTRRWRWWWQSPAFYGVDSPLVAGMMAWLVTIGPTRALTLLRDDRIGADIRPIVEATYA
jgi:hypothetical protein